MASSREKLSYSATNGTIPKSSSKQKLLPLRQVVPSGGAASRDFSKSKLMSYRRAQHFQHVLNDIM